MNFGDFFKAATGHDRFDYQYRLACGDAGGKRESRLNRTFSPSEVALQLLGVVRPLNSTAGKHPFEILPRHFGKLHSFSHRDQAAHIEDQRHFLPHLQADGRGRQVLCLHHLVRYLYGQRHSSKLTAGKGDFNVFAEPVKRGRARGGAEVYASLGTFPEREHASTGPRSRRGRSFAIEEGYVPRVYVEQMHAMGTQSLQHGLDNGPVPAELLPFLGLPVIHDAFREFRWPV